MSPLWLFRERVYAPQHCRAAGPDERAVQLRWVAAGGYALLNRLSAAR